MSGPPQAIYYYPNKVVVDKLDTSNSSLITSQAIGYSVNRLYVVGQSYARFNYPYGVALDSSGNIFVTDTNNYRIRKITPHGLVTTFAGSGNAVFADGTGTGASFAAPAGIAMDSSGNIFVGDSFGIRKVTPGGVVTTLAGSGTHGFADGTGTAALFNKPYGVAVDSSGNIIVVDNINNRIRKVTPDGIVTTLAGSGAGGFADAPSGPGTAALFNNPYGVAVDSSGNVFVADSDNHRIRKVTPGGLVTTLAGSGQPGSADGTGASASLTLPRGVAVDTSGNLFISQYSSSRIRKLTPPSGLTWDSSGAFIDSSGNGGGILTTLAGGGVGTFVDDGSLAPASFSSSAYIAIDASGNLVVADTFNQRIRKVTPGGVVTILAGQSRGYRDSELPSINWNIGWNSLVTTAQKSKSSQVTVTSGTSLDASGTYFLYPSDSGNAMYYFASQADAGGCLINSSLNIAATITKSLGVSRNYTVGNLDAMFGSPLGVVIDTSGNVFVSDSGNNLIRKITPAGYVTTLAGSGVAGFLDSNGTNAQFSYPQGMALDTSGNLFIADASNNRIRKVVISTGEVSTLAGSSQGFLDASGTIAQFDNPRGIAVDTSGNVYVADANNHRVRQIVISTGQVSTLAGSSTQGTLDSTGTNAQFVRPQGITVDMSGNVYLADAFNQYSNMIRKIVISTGVVTTLAGGSPPGFRDGIGSAANFSEPWGLVFDKNIGDIYVTDSGNDRIRKVTPAGVVTTVAGNFLRNFIDAPSGPGSAASFNYPRGVAVDASGNLLVADSGNNRIRKINISTGAVTTIAGAQDGFKNNNITLPSSQWKIASNSPGLVTTNVTASGNTIINPHGTYFLYPSAVCFLEGTTVLCFVNGNEEYVPVEKLSKETLVKTLYDGFKKIDMIAKQELFNPGTDERMEQRLYKCSTSKYPELTSDLYLTGCHSILVDTITDDERAKLTKQLGRIFVTDKKYRLTACVDERAEPWNSEGTYTVWHFALDHDNILMNYGVFVNGGLLVESCSKHVLKNKSDMVLL